MHGFKVGDRVIFGRTNGEQTLGKIIKCNPTKAKVETLVSRGTGRGAAVGTVWTVPYILMRHADTTAEPSVSIADIPISYNPFMPRVDALILEAIVATYLELSPENLSADGERPQHQRIALLRKLQMQQRSLFAAFGRPVSEQVACDWYDAKMTAERSRAARESLEAERIFQSGEPVS